MSSFNNKIVFLLSNKITQGILESQVFEFINFLNSKFSSLKIKIVYGQKTSNKALIENTNIEVHQLNNNNLNNIKNTTVYVRSFDVFLKNYLRLKVNRNIIIYDFRALVFRESYYRNKSIFKMIIIFILEFICYLLADKLCAVSNNLKNELHQIFVLKRKIFVFPCVNFSYNIFTKKKFNSNLDYKFVYVGSLSKWQMFDEILDLYKKISNKLPNTSLTVITRDKEKAISKLEIKNIKGDVKSMTSNELKNKLENYDFGFLIRKKSLVNKVSSPVKFLEYLSSGVIPIMSAEIGDYSSEVRQRKIGCIVEDDIDDLLEQIKTLKSDNKLFQRIAEYCDSYKAENKIYKHPLTTKI